MQSRHKIAIEQFLHWEKSCPDKVYLRQPRGDGGYRDYTWRETGEQVRRMAVALRELGLQPGDRVAIAATNSAHWIMADLAITAAGLVSVGLYPKQATDSVRYVLEHSETRALFLGPIAGQSGIVAGIPPGVTTIGLPYPGVPECRHEWEVLTAGAEPLAEIALPPAEELWTLVYTSGTTGRPKGVMLSHDNLAAAGHNGMQAFHLRDDERFFSYLPLAHIAERAAIAGMSVFCGGTVTFLESPERFAAQLAEVAPTRFFAVPAIWAKLRSGVLEQIPAPKLRRLLRVPLLRDLVAHRIRRGVGLHHSRSLHSGAAPLPLEMHRWFNDLGFNIVQGYGMTENTACATAARPDANRLGSVGQAMPGVEVAISDSGEILTRGATTMQGYYRNSEATAEAIDADGWLHSGDKGHLDEDGFLHITGRVKDLFKTVKGKYVAPAPIEGALAADPLIEQICVLGSGMSQPVGVAVLNPAAGQQPWEELAARLNRLLEAINATLEPHEQLSHLLVTEEAWTPDNGLVTPTLKVRREQVEARYLAEVETRLGSGETVVRLSVGAGVN